ncbi:unnamed protein product [Oikopleura dioica]|uniref:Gypsy retrotransposon integrase-like protein 1 n=1 Tax=Oikopleura dioica TaxID=34765 RepID=E4XCI8_OIKDI|nr:unnamed protein product [Oikopleura dioica]
MGSYYKLDDDSSMEIYIPSWVQKTDLPKELLLKKSHVTACHALGHCFTSGFEKLPISEFRIIEGAQAEDPTIGIIRDLIRNDVDVDKWSAPDNAYEWKKMKKFANFLFIDKTTNLLLIKLEGNVPKVVLPRALRTRYIRDAHEKGHFGVARTIEIMHWCWWSNKRDDISDFISTCEYCARRKGSYIQPATPPLKHVLKGTRPFEIIYCDYVHMPTGKTERVHRVLKNSLWGVANDQGCDWEDALPSVTSWINRGYCKSIKSTPWKIIFGYDYNDSGLALPINSTAAKTANQYAKQIRNTLSIAYEMVKLAQSEADAAVEAKKPYFAPVAIASGDQILLRREVSAEAKKTHQPYIGPFKVLKSNDCILLIDRDGATEFVHRGHVIKYKPRTGQQDDDILELMDTGPDDARPTPTTELRRSTRLKKPIARLGIHSSA